MKLETLIAELTALGRPDMDVVVAKKGYYAGGHFYHPLPFTISVQPTAYTRGTSKDILVIGVENATQQPPGLLPDNCDKDTGDGRRSIDSAE